MLSRAKDLGLGLRLHVDQLTSGGGAELAAELGATSADHLEHVSEAGLEALLGAGTIPVLCPLVPLFLREEQEAPGRRMVDAGLLRADKAMAALANPARARDPSGLTGYEYAVDWVAELLPGTIGNFNSDLIVETTIDAALQRDVQRVIGMTMASHGGFVVAPVLASWVESLRSALRTADAQVRLAGR